MKYFTIRILLLPLTFAACSILGGDEQPTIPGKIVFSAKADGDTYQLFLMNTDGSNVRQLTGGEYSATSPSWSPDGQRIAFASNRQSFSGYTTLWVVEAGGGDWQPLVRHPRTGGPVLGDHPAWSPDGTKVAFDECINCELGGGNEEIFLADLQAGTIDTLVQHPASDSYPVWSPDGGRIAFISDRAYNNADTLRSRKDLYSISVTKKKVERLTTSGSVGSYNWLSPDSISYILFDRNIQRKNLIIYDLESDEEHSVFTDLQVSQFWTFWDPVGRRFLSIEKKNNEVPVTLTLFDLDGNTVEETVLTDPTLKTAKGFKWKMKP